MTHSGTLYEKEVGTGLVVNSEKKNHETLFAPQGITYQTSNPKNSKLTKQSVPWKSTAGKVTEWSRCRISSTDSIGRTAL